MSEKECRDCGLVKPVAEFWKRKASHDGLALYCKECFGLRNAAATRRRLAKQGKSARPYQKRRVLPEGMKYCPRCQEIKATADFPRNRSSKSGVGGYCKPCYAQVVVENRERNHGSTRNYFYKLRYGVTEEQVDAHRRAQGGICPICLRVPAAHVDHDHETGLFRGLLCFRCNGALGQFEDDPWRMRECADYLEGRSSHSRTMMLEFGVLVIDGHAHRLACALPRRGTTRDDHLRERYGIGEAEIERLVRAQAGSCPICCDRSAEHVDHDHATGAVRGVLCGSCNTGMGQLDDDPVSLRRAADYVQGRLIMRLPAADGGVRFSFTWPDVDPATVAVDGWEPYRAADGAHRRLLQEWEGRMEGQAAMRFAVSLSSSCRREVLMPGAQPVFPRLVAAAVAR
ncbi:endonuclease VII domain-containing protein [Spirillospora sp. NPDC029432]|uniref:endonuclease VII domain-containing protein n=1 Tax=Spirillospora sp. NPDC029432 TaxID=3154599 RepID=UPI003456168A